MSYNYAVTAYKATAVTAVLTGNFTGENELNLILVRGCNLVVNVVTPEGLKSVVDANVRGRICLAKLIRPAVSHFFISSVCAAGLTIYIALGIPIKAHLIWFT